MKHLNTMYNSFNYNARKQINGEVTAIAQMHISFLKIGIIYAITV